MSFSDLLSADRIVMLVAPGSRDVVLDSAARLLADPEVGAVVDRVVFAAGDALGAVGGVAALAELGRTPSVVSGVVTSSPLATAEARRALDVPVAGTFDLTEAEVARGLVEDLLEERLDDAS